jgi:tRNA A37 methylthiotransferase MiaB
MSKKVFIKTFGCQTNENDSDKKVDVLGRPKAMSPHKMWTRTT